MFQQQSTLEYPVLIAYHYDVHMRKLVHLMKYGGNQRMAYFFGELMASRILEEGFGPFHCIIPVPLHPRREKERGFNQSRLMAEGISRVLNIPVEDHLIIRNRYTHSQASLSREERLKNLENVFQADIHLGQKLQNKDVLVVDDLVTTGSTFNEVNKCLTRLGVHSILNVALASSA